MAQADDRRRLGVRANSDNGQDSARAVRFGAQGIGLTRTEHMFLGERRQLVERLILAEDDAGREAALAAARAAAARRLRRDLRGDGRAAGHDPAARPAAARVPARPDRAVGQGRAGRRRGDRRRTASCSTRCAGCTSRTRCSACAASGSASSSPACTRCRSGRSRTRPSTGSRRAATPSPEIMIPLVGAVQELEAARDETEQVLEEVAGRDRRHRAHADRHDDRGAAGRADRRPDRRGRRVLLVRHQRPDPDGLGLLPRRRRGLVLRPVHRDGHLRRLAVRDAGRRRHRPPGRIAVEEGRQTRPDLKIGVCGEHGGDPDSVHFFHEAGLDYVSCSPFRVPVARLEAGRAVALAETGGSDSR